MVIRLRFFNFVFAPLLAYSFFSTSCHEGPTSSVAVVFLEYWCRRSSHGNLKEAFFSPAFLFETWRFSAMLSSMSDLRPRRCCRRRSLRRHSCVSFVLKTFSLSSSSSSSSSSSLPSFRRRRRLVLSLVAVDVFCFVLLRSSPSLAASHRPCRRRRRLLSWIRRLRRCRQITSRLYVGLYFVVVVVVAVVVVVVVVV